MTCKICNRNGCTESFHSIDEQEAVEKPCAEKGCARRAAYQCGGYCRYHWDAVSNTFGT